MEELRKIQLKCIEILNIVDGVCRKHQIDYSLCGGSVVGAHLYGGCLPWDDDIDLMMTRENYNRFLKVAQAELPEGFSIHNYELSEEYWSTFTKIVNDNTTIVQQDGTVSGVFLDITVYDKIPNGVFKNIDIVLWKISQVVAIGTLENKSLKAVLRNFVLNTFLKNERKYLCFFQKQVERLSNTTNYHYSELFGAFCNTKSFSPSIFENYTQIEFEGKQYMIVREYVRYLEIRYERTDFREPKERQIAPHYQYVDFTLPYREYIKNQNSRG